MSKRAKILIVEDNPDIADDIAERLAGLGYNVCATVPGDLQAVDAAVKIAPDLALIGIGPEETMSGVDIAKSVYDRLGIPIVYLTDYVNDELLNRVKITRAFGHIFKPYLTEQLRLSIENHLFWHEEDQRSANQERRRATILDSLGEGVIAANKDGKIIFENSVAKRLTGWEKRQAMDQPLWDVFKTVVEKDGDPAQQAVVAALENSSVVERIDHDTVLIRRDGGKVPIDFTAAPITDTQKNHTGVVIVFRDTSKLKAAERDLEQTIGKLQNQTQLMETVFESMSDGVVATDEAGNFLLVNPSAEEIVGMEAGDTPADEWSERFGTFYEDGVTLVPMEELPLVHAMQGKATDGVNLIIRNAMRPDGIYINVHGRPLLEKKGGVRGGVIILRDVTKLKHAELRLEETIEKLKSQTQFMESIFDNISDGVVVANENAEIRIFNPGAERILGRKFWEGPPETWTLDALIGGSDFYYPDRVTPYLQEELPLKRAIRGKATDEVNMFVSNSEVYPEGAFISASGRPIRNQWGIENGGVVVFRDITERVLEEEALAQAFAQGRLEVVDTILHNIGNAINSVMVGIGTLHEELIEDKLIQRFTALADAVKRHEDDWVGYIKNDPQGKKALPFMLALAEDFAKQNERLERTVDRVSSRATHIADIIRTQKSYCAVSAVRKDIILQKALTDAAKLLQESMDTRSIEIRIDCSNAPREVRIQENQFHQMIVNLIKNSIEAIDELTQRSGLNGAPRIEINGYVQDDFLLIDIVDNGIGLEPESYKKVFAAGYTTKKSGSGLGLHSSANFAIGCGGEIQPLSDGIGKGTTMRVKLRLATVTP